MVSLMSEDQPFEQEHLAVYLHTITTILLCWLHQSFLPGLNLFESCKISFINNWLQFRILNVAFRAAEIFVRQASYKQQM